MMMKVVWLCGLPNEVRLNALGKPLSNQPTPAWSWILGHLPPPDDIELHIICPVFGLDVERVDFTYYGAHWHCFKRKSPKHFFAYVRYFFVVRAFVKALAADVVHGWGGETGFGFFATKISKRSVVSVQGLLLLLYKASPEAFQKEMGRTYSRYMLWRERLTYKNASKLLTESEFSRSALFEHYGCESKVIPHPLRRAFLAQGKVGSRASATQFVYVGVLVARKGALDIVMAFSMMRNFDSRLVIIGVGPELPRIQEFISDKGLEKCIEIKRGCSSEEIATIMQQSHFFVLPTYGDTGPTALKEALACGLFPICYDNTGPHEYLTRYCGYLVPTGDVVAYSAAMENAILHRVECAQKAASSAIRIKEDSAKAAVWNSLKDVYKDTVK